MYNIGIIGSNNYFKQDKVLALFEKIKFTFGKTATILSGGNEKGIERDVKKLALDLGMKYKEYNPSWSGYNLYSQCEEKYYGKKFHCSHAYDRYKQLVNNCDYLFIFIDKSNELQDMKIFKYVEQLCQKNDKKVTIID